ncbi:hypothetical protein MY04_5311 [Flammeovirga sp. MY04]|uniref:carboxypeptidase-like regulatory domain-containing protein n=1 Tax=Flammeovirga sp. MY04 TaxID=1191459 RepID=UPI0008062B52|nr:carboxypeptidase-like regulatory domain-containing protein [Flammeovirga sp. MY04]ANQ52643.1 hypothetical protein MY04_5311 [Flammeovirga sp. MY04]
MIETAKDYYYNKPGQKTKEEFKAKDSNIRDRLMGENMLYLLNKYPNKKMIVWGATGHIMGRLEGYNEELDEFYPLGSYIKNELGDAAYVLAFTGKIKDVDRFETIEEEFYATGNKYGFYPLHTSEEISSTAISYDEPKDVKPLTADWSQAFDGMFFVDQLKLAKHKEYDCGESLLIKPVELQNDSLKTTYSFQLENTEEVVIPTIYLKDKKSIRNQIGIVYDEKTKKVLPSVSVVTTNSKRGTATDMNGKFDIAIPSPQDSIIISSIGYETIKIAPSDRDIEVFLHQKVDEMSTLTISSEPLTAKSILKKVIKSIPKNYYQGPFTKYFDNEFIHTYLKDGTTSFYKINFEVYDKNGYKSEMMFPIRYTGFRKVLEASSCPINSIENKPLILTKLDEKKMNLAQYGNYLIGYDIVNVRHNNFLNMSKFGKYDFEFSDVIFIDGKEVYVLKFYTEENSFRSTVILEPKTFYGTIYINADDHAITKVEYSVVHDVERLQHYYPFQKYPLEPLSFSNLSVTYKKNKDGFYYVNDIIAEANIPGRPTYSHLKVINIEIGERDREEGEYH